MSVFHYAATFSDGSLLTFYANSMALAKDHAAHVAGGLTAPDGLPLLVTKVRRAYPEDADSGRWAKAPAPTRPTLTLAGETMTIERGSYYHPAHGFTGGGIALRIYDANGQPFLTLTTNIEGAVLFDGEFCVKTWSENEPYIADILASGLFEDTGRRVLTGFVEAPVWRMK
jgi:hypothetical protein